MTSILTNNSAMVALQTLKSINSSMSATQAEISTGKSIGSARDNSAIWAISQVMESDVAGFSAISESLSLGSSTVAVARTGAERITDLLNQVKEKVVAAQEQNVDRDKIQTDIGKLRDQITSIVNAAQFNGLNLLKGGGDVDILSSLDRAADGTVTASHISIAKQDLQQSAEAFGATAVGAAGDLITNSVTSAMAGAATNSTVVAFTAGGAEEGASYHIGLTGGGANDVGTTEVMFEYVARDGDTELDVSQALYDEISDYITENSLTGVSITRDATTGALTIQNDGALAADTLTVDVVEALDGTAGGGLAALGTMDVTTDAGAASALSDIEVLIQASIDAAAEFGSAEGRIDIQTSFVGALSDSMKSGIGALVDANMEEASARLQALQVQQQLGIQALSIANQQPQNILALFR
jgi:flagellin